MTSVRRSCHEREAGIPGPAGGARGEGDELGDFLRSGRELAKAEEGTVTWYAFRIDETHFGIFDTFETEDARTAHLSGPLAKALGEVADDLLAAEPSIQPADVIAVK